MKGATVNLYDESGKVVGTTKTTARGEYYFDDSNVTGGLKPHTKYTIRIDNPADYAKGGPLYHWVPTDHDVGDNHFIDSKGIVPADAKFPERALTTGGPGENDHTFDFGYRQQEGALKLVKHDQDGKPLAGAKFQLWHETNGGVQGSGGGLGVAGGAVEPQEAGGREEGLLRADRGAVAEDGGRVGGALVRRVQRAAGGLGELPAVDRLRLVRVGGRGGGRGGQEYSGHGHGRQQSGSTYGHIGSTVEDHLKRSRSFVEHTNRCQSFSPAPVSPPGPGRPG